MADNTTRTVALLNALTKADHEGGFAYLSVEGGEIVIDGRFDVDRLLEGLGVPDLETIDDARRAGIEETAAWLETWGGQSYTALQVRTHVLNPSDLMVEHRRRHEASGVGA